jgi:hypothetical protein
MDGFVGGGKLIITAGAGAVITGTLNVVGSSHFVRIAGCVVTDDNSAADEATNATILVNTSRHVEVVMCQLQGNNPNAQYNVAFIQGSEGNVTNCQLNGASSATVRATEASIIKCEDNKGNGPQSYNSSASIIFKNGTWPTGGGATGSQGIIITAGGIGPAIDTPATPAGDASGNQGPTSTKKTKTWAAAAGSTYGLSYNTWSGGDVTQGSYGGSQNHKGLWRLPSGVAGTLGGKNIQAAYVTITRASYGGGSGAVAVMLATFNQNVLSGAGNPGVNDGPANVGALAWGQTKTFKIANSWVDYLKGGGRTLGVYAASGSPYAIFKNNLKLKVTYI